MGGQIPLFYFSGTGNTWWIGNQLADALTMRGYQTQLHSIEKVTYKKTCELIGSAEIVGLGYPIYGSDAPGIMKTFIQRLPVLEAPKPMLIFVTQAEWSGNGAYFLRHQIEAKGYEVRWAVHFNMPNNIAIDLFPFNSTAEYVEFVEKIIDAAAITQNLADMVKSGERWIQGKNPFAWLAAWVQRAPFRYALRWMQGRIFSVDTEKCIQCSRCENLCPVENVKLTVAGFPEWGNNCILCMRCFNYCPEQAILAYRRPFNSKRFGARPYQGPVPEFRPERIVRPQE